MGKWKDRWITGGEPNTEVGRRVLLSLVVSQCNSLGRHFEVNDGGSWRGVSSQCLGSGFGDGLWPSERLHVHRVDEEHVAGWKKPTQGDVMGAERVGMTPRSSLQANLKPRHLSPEMWCAHPETFGSGSDV